MQLRFEETTKEIWRERVHREQKCRVDLESVVPDVYEDVGRVASLRCTVLLKSKEVGAQGIVLGGEAEAVVLYITENADAVSCVRLTKEFSCTVETDGTELSEAQGTLRVLRTEARILNPRKLAVSAEIVCEVYGYGREAVTTRLMPDAEAGNLLEGQQTEITVQLPAAVTEKSFALTESFVFGPEKAAPLQLLGRELSFRLTEQSRVGSRLIVKGAMELAILYEAEGICWPLRQVFSAPVSQILDLGSENAVCCRVLCEPTAVYLTLTDSISGGKAVEAEIHALLQAVSRTEEKLFCLTDAYSNLMPLRCEMRRLSAPRCGETERSLSTADEPIAVAEDCADLLCVLPNLTRDGAQLSVELDLIYRTKTGEIAAARRTLALRGDTLPPEAEILSASLTRCDLHPEGEGLSCSLAAELSWRRSTEEIVEAVESVSLDEEHPYDRSALPGFTLVRAEGESLWELARAYHSSASAIAALNDIAEPAGRMLLIPRV